MSDSLSATVIVIEFVSTISANGVLEPDDPLELLEAPELAPPRLPAAEVPVPAVVPEEPEEPEEEPEPEAPEPEEPADTESPGGTL
jgi:outer membrane biosynthesis protein TonB